MGEPKMERTTIELLKKPDLELLRNLKASLTLKFNTEVSYRDAILYLFISRVLGTKSVNTFINSLFHLKFKGSLSETLKSLINILEKSPRFKEELLGYWEDAVRKDVGESISFYKTHPDKEVIIDALKFNEKEFLEALKKIEKAKIDVLWKAE